MDAAKLNLSGLINKAILFANGRNVGGEFALFVDGNLCVAMVGGEGIVLGEQREQKPKFEGRGASPEEAVSGLIANLAGNNRYG